MPRAYSADMRVRVIARVESGASRREAAEHYEVSASTAVTWVRCFRESGRCAAKPRGGKPPYRRAAAGNLVLAPSRASMITGILPSWNAVASTFSAISDIDGFFGRRLDVLQRGLLVRWVGGFCLKFARRPSLSYFDFGYRASCGYCHSSGYGIGSISSLGDQHYVEA